MTKYQEPQYSSQKQPPPPDPIVVDDEIEYKVEEILDSRFRKSGRGQPKLEYYVKWKGYQVGIDAWQPKENITHATELINNFHDKNPRKPGQKISLRKIEVSMSKIKNAEIFQEIPDYDLHITARRLNFKQRQKRLENVF